MEDSIPRSKVEELARQIRELRNLEARKAGTQAELIRWCLTAIRMDPNTHMLRGHEGWQARHKQIEKNKNDQKLAFLYLEWLATQLENQSVASRDNDQSKENDDVHGSPSVPLCGPSDQLR